jgi:hypothetical protein
VDAVHFLTGGRRAETEFTLFERKLKKECAPRDLDGNWLTAPISGMINLVRERSVESVRPAVIPSKKRGAD